MVTNIQYPTRNIQYPSEIARRRAAAALCAALAFCLCGCVKQKIVLRVKPDGTGNIIVSRVFARELVAMYEAQAKEAEGSTHLPKDPFYNEQALRHLSGQFGPGVRFVKAKRYDRAGARGFVALYAFTNIATVFVNPDMLAPQPELSLDVFDDDDEIEIAEREEGAIGFELARGAEPRVTVRLPEYPGPVAHDAEDAPSDERFSDAAPVPGGLPGQAGAAEELMAGGNPYGFTGDESEAEIMQRVLRGMRVELVIEAVGANVPRVSLVDLDIGRLVQSARGRRIMEDGGPFGGEDFTDFVGQIQGLPGVRIETNRQVVVRFR